MRDEIREEQLTVVKLLITHTQKHKLELYSYQRCPGNTKMTQKIIFGEAWRA